MVIEWKSMLLIVAVLFLALVGIKLLDKKFKLNAELKRKAFHVSMGIVMLALPYICTSVLTVGILAVISILIMIILKNTKLKKTVGSVLYGVERESFGEIFYIISVFLIFYLSKGNKVLYSIPILILTFADSAAALVGKNYGKANLAKMNEDAKSIEGSFMFFIVAFMGTLVPLLLFTEVGRSEVLIISAIIGFNVALIEMISHTGNDNLLIPLTTYAFLVTHIEVSTNTLIQDVAIIGILFVLITIVNRIKMWSKLALVEILVVGYLITSLYGWYAIIPPLLLLLTVMRFPKLREKEKQNMYDSRIIETNIIIGTAICGIVAITGWKKEFFMIYGTCYAMHLIVNTYVRLKFYCEMSEYKSLILSIIKGILCVFIPSLIIQKCIFDEFGDISMLIVMGISMVISAFLIDYEKKDVKKEEILVSNGYLHMAIVLVLTVMLGISQFLIINCKF